MIKFRIFNKTAGMYHVGFVRELLIDVDKEGNVVVGLEK